MKRARMPVVVLLTAALILPACTTQSQRIGADDGSDVCRPQRAALDSTGDYFAEDMVKGAAIGAVGGALLGAVTGGRNAGRNALIGAALGAAVGAAGGYWASKMQQEQSRDRLYSSVASDLSRENQQLDATQLAFDHLVDCRRNEASRIRSALVTGQVSRLQAEGMMADVRRRYAEDIQIAQRISGRVSERSANFQFANEQINPQPYYVQMATPMRVRPESNAGSMGMLQAGTYVYASREDDRWMRVDHQSGPGFVPIETLVAYVEPQQQQARPGARPAPQQQAVRRPPPPRRADPQQQQVASATSTNLAKRDQFQRSVQTAQANSSAFELS
ncbi:MAG: YMGG-like glycine zipper-containing protein [Alphaproteobacteria bacterium]